MKGERSVQQQTSKGEEQTKVEKLYECQHYLSETDDDELSKWMMFSRDFGIFKKKWVEEMLNVKFIQHARNHRGFGVEFSPLFPFHFNSFSARCQYSRHFPLLPPPAGVILCLDKHSLLLSGILSWKKFSTTVKIHFLSIMGVMRRCWITSSFLSCCWYLIAFPKSCLPEMKLKTFSCCSRRLDNSTLNYSSRSGLKSWNTHKKFEMCNNFERSSESIFVCLPRVFVFVCTLSRILIKLSKHR